VQRSQELHERLREANPAPIGSDAWARNYREATLKEQAQRAAPPDLIRAEQLRAEFVPNPMHQDLPPELFGVVGCFWECLMCSDVVHSLPKATVSCRCMNILINAQEPSRTFQNPAQVRLVKLIAKA